MKICLLNDSFPPVIDGVANVVMNYGNVLTNDLMSEVVVGTPRYPKAVYDGYPYRVIPYPSFDTTDFVNGYRTGNPLSVREIAQMAEFKPDIIHTHCPAASTVMARILRKETGAPVVFTYHTKFDVDIERAVGEGFLKKETIKAMVSNIEACDDVWVVSEGAGENLRALGYEGKLRVMPNGVDFPKGRADESRIKELNEAYDIPEGVPLFLFVGRIMKYKGLFLIADAVKELSAKGIDYRMVFVGGGADAEELQGRIRDYGIAHDIYCEGKEADHVEGNGQMTGKVIFTGPEHDREKLRAWNSRADLFLFPSTYDTNGIVVREAAACGLASALVKGSCAAEGITDQRNGYLIEENAESMAALLMSVHDKLPQLHRTGENAMNEIYISWDMSVRLAYDRYKELIRMKAEGELGIRKHQSFEALIKTAALAMDGTQKAFFETPKNIYEGMRENFEELRSFHYDMTQEMRMGFEEFKNEVTGGLERISDSIAEGLTEIKDKIHDGTDRT